MARINSDSPFARFLEQKINDRANNDEIVRGAPAGSAIGKLRDRANAICEQRGLSFAEAFAVALTESPLLYQQYLEESGKSV